MWAYGPAAVSNALAKVIFVIDSGDSRAKAHEKYSASDALALSSIRLDFPSLEYICTIYILTIARSSSL